MNRPDPTAGSQAAGSRATDKAGRPPLALFVFIVLGVWLTWQVVREAALRQAPTEAALRLAPGSAMLLARAAEAELGADRTDNALWLARRALQAAPFTVAALRVAGLALARQEATDQADDVLTLAGNWSLRDDRAHGWLVERRLQQGDYGSAFAHADALVRRREALRPPVFELFTAAAAADGQARAALAARLGLRPAWRRAYLAHLNASPEGLGLSAGLAVALKDAPGRYDDREMGAVHARLAAAGQYDVIRQVRSAMAGGDAPPFLVDGDFARAEGRGPFEWTLHRRPGVTAAIAAGPGEGGPALHVIHDTYSAGVVASQTLLLPPGRYRLTGRVQSTEGDPGRLSWRVQCATGAVAGPVLGQVALGEAVRGRWTAFELALTAPAQGCPAQWLTLVPHPGDRRRTLDIWFDDLRIDAVRP